MRPIDPDTNGNQRVQFNATLKSLSEKVLTNVNGKNYRIATIDFEDAKGVKQTTSAMVFEGNYSHGMSLGKEYLCTATMTQQGVIVNVSHLDANAGRADVDMFVFDGVAVGNSTAPATKKNAIPAEAQ